MNRHQILDIQYYNTLIVKIIKLWFSQSHLRHLKVYEDLQLAALVRVPLTSDFSGRWEHQRYDITPLTGFWYTRAALWEWAAFPRLGSRRRLSIPPAGSPVNRAQP